MLGTCRSELLSPSERVAADAHRLSENAERTQLQMLDMPSEIEGLARGILPYTGCARLLHLLASRPQTANTLSDLAHLLNEREDIVRRGLGVLADHGAVQEFTAAGRTFYALSRDSSARARILAFLDWRRQRIQHMRRLLRLLEADGHADMWGE